MRLTQSDRLIIAFVQGAQWWEYQRTKATMWPSDSMAAERAAEERLRLGSLGNFRINQKKGHQ